MTILTLQPETPFILLGIIALLVSGYSDHLLQKTRIPKELKLLKFSSTIMFLLSFCCFIVTSFLLASN